ncbi:hypothetical protein YC2023_041290 [Brassica napus]
MNLISHFGDVGFIYGDSRLRITAGQTETAPVVVLGGVDACRWRQDAKAPARTPLLHGDNRSLVHEPLLRDGGCVTSSRSSNTRTDEEHGGEEENGTSGEQKRWGGDEA